MQTVKRRGRGMRQLFGSPTHCQGVTWTVRAVFPYVACGFSPRPLPRPLPRGMSNRVISSPVGFKRSSAPTCGIHCTFARNADIRGRIRKCPLRRSIPLSSTLLSAKNKALTTFSRSVVSPVAPASGGAVEGGLSVQERDGRVQGGRRQVHVLHGLREVAVSGELLDRLCRGALHR